MCSISTSVETTRNYPLPFLILFIAINIVVQPSRLLSVNSGSPPCRVFTRIGYSWALLAAQDISVKYIRRSSFARLSHLHTRPPRCDDFSQDRHLSPSAACTGCKPRQQLYATSPPGRNDYSLRSMGSPTMALRHSEWGKLCMVYF